MESLDSEDDSNSPLPKQNLRSGLFVFSLLAVCAALAFVFVLEPQEAPPVVAKPPAKAIVSVIDVPVQSASAVVRTLAQVRPMWTADLYADRAARVLSVKDKALAGRQVAKGDVLVELDASALYAELRAAQLALVEAEVGFDLAREQTELRRRQASRQNADNQTTFSLLLPELRIAENALVSAQARLESTQVALSNATIRAPFDGFVTDRMVSPGQSVTAGETLLSIVNGTEFEIEAGLSPRQWRLLQHPISNTEAEVRALDGTRLGTARVRDAGGFRDDETREFKVFLEITRSPDQPASAQLLSGALIEIAFRGTDFEDTLDISEHSMTREGHIWYVDAEDRLQRFQPDILWRDEDVLVVKAPSDQPRFRIAAVPLAGFLTGAEVTPVTRETR